MTAIYITETSGALFKYSGEFANLFEKVNLGIDAGYTSSSYTDNFFGFGNETPNFEDDIDRDFNRVRLQTLNFSPSLIFRGFHGSQVKVSLEL